MDVIHFNIAEMYDIQQSKIAERLAINSTKLLRDFKCL
jgi:hypothetical protein